MEATKKILGINITCDRKEKKFWLSYGVENIPNGKY